MFDAKWLEFFKLPLRAIIAIALASGALLVLVLTHVLDLGPISTFALPVLIIVVVASVAAAIVGCGESLFAPLREKKKESALVRRRAIRRKEEDEHREQRQETTLSQLDHLSKEEIAIVVNALRGGSPSFYTYVFSPPVSMLQGKRLVWTPGGQHHQDYYPYSFHDFVWKVLLERKDEFFALHAEHKKAEEERKKAERNRRGY
ncbi:hypothetical protein LQG66_09970 [Bradyrhizobium ontarionense]|uniref:Uncharacterized protein n=1 Tax=Bradyrhizobium ontarionense TaxID=2898149 RepID=A0ABY3RGK8_9BRAD|nr:hypothetical protein [Bradyrhizobium sp. A19]UFZ06594.1 hypothetical protein LQG66_09970 [Bradyrhizobium sp. A19]